MYVAACIVQSTNLATNPTLQKHCACATKYMQHRTAAKHINNGNYNAWHEHARAIIMCKLNHPMRAVMKIDDQYYDTHEGKVRVHYHSLA